MDSVQDYNELLGVETLHPLVSVVDFSELESVRHCLKNFGFYCIYLKHINCGPLLYGRNQYDYLKERWSSSRRDKSPASTTAKSRTAIRAGV